MMLDIELSGEQCARLGVTRPEHYAQLLERLMRESTARLEHAWRVLAAAGWSPAELHRAVYAIRTLPLLAPLDGDAIQDAMLSLDDDDGPQPPVDALRWATLGTDVRCSAATATALRETAIAALRRHIFATSAL